MKLTIQEEVKILQDDKEILLEKGDKIEVLEKQDQKESKASMGIYKALSDLYVRSYLTIDYEGGWNLGESIKGFSSDHVGRNEFLRAIMEKLKVNF